MKRILSTLILTISLAACSSREIEQAPGQDVFRPATQQPTDLPPLSAPGQVPGQDSQLLDVRPTSTPSCTSGLWFLADLTIPDGTVVQPGEMLDKRWEVKNSGTCNWDERYQVRLIAGPGIGVPVQQALVPALSGTMTMIRMVFIAPEEPGSYRSAWQAYDPQGNAFGDPFFIDIVVEAAVQEETPTLQPEESSTGE